MRGGRSPVGRSPVGPVMTTVGRSPVGPIVATVGPLLANGGADHATGGGRLRANGKANPPGAVAAQRRTHHRRGRIMPTVGRSAAGQPPAGRPTAGADRRGGSCQRWGRPLESSVLRACQCARAAQASGCMRGRTGMKATTVGPVRAVGSVEPRSAIGRRGPLIDRQRRGLLTAGATQPVSPLPLAHPCAPERQSLAMQHAIPAPPLSSVP